MQAGLLAEFEGPEAMLEGARRLRARGLTRLDSFSPWPVHGLEEALGTPPSPVARIVLVAGLCGAALAYWIQWVTSAVLYPLNVGGRPLHSAPAYVLITFETTVLFGGFAALFSVLA